MAQAEDWMFDMGLVERPVPEDPVVRKQLEDQMEAYKLILAEGESGRGLKELAADMFAGREWTWDNA